MKCLEECPAYNKCLVNNRDCIDPVPGIFTHTNCFYPHDPLKCYTFPVETEAWQG